MKYRWVKQPITKDSIEKLLGKKIKRLTIGQLDNGEDEPISGIEIEVDEDITETDLQKVDQSLPNMKRLVLI